MPVFTANIPGILKVGDRIAIGGKIKENARKMSVNLCAQEGEEPRDVVLHFDVRFHRDNIISLSRKNGVWIGSGNYDTNYNMFVPGTIFRIVFEIKHTDVITIYCQGKFHSNFLPKIPLTMAKYIVAWADIERVTHCYFYLDNKAVGDESFFSQMPTQQNQSAGDAKRRHPCRGYFKPEPNLIYHQHHTVPGKRSSKISPNSQKKSYMPGSPQAVNSTDESSERELRGRTKGNRADRHFYETLMYPQAHRMRADPPRNRADLKKYNRCGSDTDGKYTEDVSKTETDSR